MTGLIRNNMSDQRLCRLFFCGIGKHFKNKYEGMKMKKPWVSFPRVLLPTTVMLEWRLSNFTAARIVSKARSGTYKVKLLGYFINGEGRWLPPYSFYKIWLSANVKGIDSATRKELAVYVEFMLSILNFFNLATPSLPSFSFSSSVLSVCVTQSATWIRSNHEITCATN